MVINAEYRFTVVDQLQAIGVIAQLVLEPTRRDTAAAVATATQLAPAADMVALITARSESEAGAHREVQRPWGRYLSIDLGIRHQVKRVTVKPGGVLSLQKHFHRAEHWVVVRVTAEVTRNDETMVAHENE